MKHARDLIYTLAKGICKTLFDQGYIAYFAGGWVRDLLLNKETDEIDIATNAPPYVVQKLFDKTIPVGIAFGVVIVVQEGVNFEVTTFRKDHTYFDGRHPEGIDFSSPEKDAERRDFTINGMFYDPLTQTIYDYVGGQEDLKKGIIRAIGNPLERFTEDKLRMIRAIRFAARLSFTIEEKTGEAILNLSSQLIPAVSIERIWQEFCKMTAYPHLDRAISMLHQFQLLSTIFPQLKDVSKNEIAKRTESFPYFPLGTPPIVFLLDLFPALTLEEKIEICVFLKTSNEERNIVTFFSDAQALFSRENTELYDWAYFYAHPLSQLYIGIAAAKILPSKRLRFLEEHEKRQHLLKTHIERIKTKKPLVTSSHIKNMGIPAGKKMGIFLKMAERMVINENVKNPEMVIEALRKKISDF